MDDHLWSAICTFCFIVGLIIGITLGQHTVNPNTSETRTFVITFEGKDYRIKEKL